MSVTTKAAPRRRQPLIGVSVLDIVFVLTVIGVFLLIGLASRGVGKL